MDTENVSKKGSMKTVRSNRSKLQASSGTTVQPEILVLPEICTVDKDSTTDDEPLVRTDKRDRCTHLPDGQCDRDTWSDEEPFDSDAAPPPSAKKKKTARSEPSIFAQINAADKAYKRHAAQLVKISDALRATTDAMHAAKATYKLLVDKWHAGSADGFEIPM